MKSTFPRFFLFITALLFSGDFVNAFVIQAPVATQPKQAKKDRKLDFVSIFRGRNPAPVDPKKKSSNSDNRILQLLQLANTFTGDENFLVKVDISYKNTGQPVNPDDLKNDKNKSSKVVAKMNKKKERRLKDKTEKNRFAKKDAKKHKRLLKK